MNIWAVGRNYSDHAKEMGSTVPSKPMIFLKAGSTVVSDDRVSLWRGSQDIHHEIEIALRFGTGTGADLTFDAVALALDLTARDLQAKLKADGHPWTLAKSFIASCPMGPTLPLGPYPNTAEVPEFEFEFSVNGQVRQHGHTKDMVFGFEALRRYCLECFPVKPGDWLLTGTPSGVGRLTPGDRGEAWLRSSLGHESKMRWEFC